MAEHIFNDISVMIPRFQFMKPEVIDNEPWKLPVPVYFLGRNDPIPYTICCEEYNYYMTDSKRALEEELERYGFEMPDFSEFHPNPALAHNVRLKMIELDVCWSIAKKAGPIGINYYSKEKGAFFFPLKAKEKE